MRCYCVRRLELGLDRIRRCVIEDVTWSKLMLNGYHKNSSAILCHTFTMDILSCLILIVSLDYDNNGNLAS